MPFGEDGNHSIYPVLCSVSCAVTRAALSALGHADPFPGMEYLDQTQFLGSTPAAQSLSTAVYVTLLHPISGLGKPTIMTIEAKDHAHSKICRVEDAPWAAECRLDGSASISLHRFHGPKRDARLADINALYLDPDVDLAPRELTVDWVSWSPKFSLALVGHGIRAPSFQTHTERGLAAIWLIEGMQPQARTRRKAAQNALISVYRQYGADPKCCDTARVIRLPGYINPKSGGHEPADPPNSRRGDRLRSETRRSMPLVSEQPIA